MKYTDVVVLIPSHSLEDFPTEQSEEESAGLLNAFAVAWHPLLLASTATIPTWHRADEPPDVLEDRLLLVPTVCDDWLPAGWKDRAANEGAVVVTANADRDEMIRAATEPLVGTAEDAESADGNESNAARAESPELDDDLVRDFLAFGFCYLQLELLTRHMHHFNSMDEVHLQREAVSAAESALANDATAAREHLRACFETLTEARERFYPVDCYLLDLCLLTPDLADEKLTNALTQTKPINIMLSGKDLSKIATEKPDVIRALRESWHRGTCDMVGGEFDECAAPVVPIETALYDFAKGHRQFREIFDKTPATWLRRRYGLSPMLPQILNKYGYHSALHFLLDDGIYPDAEQSKLRWEGSDGTVIDAMSRIPLAADSATSYLRLPMRMAESMEEDQAAALVFARWPEIKSPFFDDLCRMQQYSPVLGRFTTFDDYFQYTDTPGRLSSHDAKEYLSPFLTQNVARQETNPISRFTNHFIRRHRFEAADWLQSLSKVLSGKSLDEPAELETEAAIEQAGPDTEDDHASKADAALSDFSNAAAKELSDGLLHRGGDQSGYLIVNPLSFSRTIAVDLPDRQHAPPIEGAVKGTQFDESRKTALVEVPGCGFVWLANSNTESNKEQPSKVPLAEDNLLRNELFEVAISEVTGGIARIKGYGRSPNRLSQQLAFRFPRERSLTVGEGEAAEETKTYYSQMRCLDSKVTCNGPALGEIVTSGEIIDQQNDTRLAGYQQTVRVWRGRPVVELEIELEIDRMPEGDPWSNYFGCRFAWNDITASLTRALLTGAQSVGSERFESPYYLEIADEQQRTTILSCGLPFHRKTGLRMLDSILVTSGENQHRFRFVIAVDENYPMQSALDAMVPASVIPTSGGPPVSGDAGWFFHVNTRNVLITRILPLIQPMKNSVSIEEEYDHETPGQGHGFALRLIETEGRHKSVKLTCFRTPTTARQRDFQGRTISDLNIEDDCVRLEITPHEIADVELRFED